MIQTPEQATEALFDDLCRGSFTGADRAAAERIIANARRGRYLAGWQQEARDILDRARAKLT
jgi:hypothetical protein